MDRLQAALMRSIERCSLAICWLLKKRQPAGQGSQVMVWREGETRTVMVMPLRRRQ